MYVRNITGSNDKLYTEHKPGKYSTDLKKSNNEIGNNRQETPLLLTKTPRQLGKSPHTINKTNLIEYYEYSIELVLFIVSV